MTTLGSGPEPGPPIRELVLLGLAAVVAVLALGRVMRRGRHRR